MLCVTRVSTRLVDVQLKIVDALAELDLGVVDTPVRHAIDSSQLIQTVELAQPMEPVYERAAAAVGAPPPVFA